MFRCPQCRARKEFKIRHTGYVYKVLPEEAMPNKPITFQSKEFECKKGNEKLMADHEKYKHYKMTCSACGHKDEVEKFEDAFNDSMKYFDTQNLCDCGGEVWQDIEVKKVEILNAEQFVGDQRKVSQQVISVLRCDSCKKESKMQRLQ